MNRPPLRHVAVGLVLACAAGLAPALTPQAPPVTRPAVVLDELVPRSFGPWRLEAADNVLVVTPEQQALLGELYQDTLSRTYRHRETGARVMLSVAYGGAQTDTLRVHRPERCYAAQGFQVSDADAGALETPWQALPVRRLTARAGWRHEPITYWVTMGQQAVTAGSVAEKIAQIRHGLTGQVPDGMLVRVSTVDDNAPRAWRQHQQFVNDLLGALEPQRRQRLIGQAPSAPAPGRG